jgi:hypothetical protein
MIIESQKLKVILDLILCFDLDFPGLNLEISKSKSNDYLIIAANYNDLYYISYTINIANEINQENFDVNYLVIPKDGVKKLYQLTTLWPKSVVKITGSNGLVSFEVVEHGQLVRERPVYIECLFQPAINDYIIEPPPMRYNCVVNSRNLKQMLEFCMLVNDGIILEIRENWLSISSTNSSIATLVELEEILEKPSKKIKLSTEANSLIISFLNKLVNKFNLVYLLFIEHDTAVSIRIKIDELNTIQIYTIHD